MGCGSSSSATVAPLGESGAQDTPSKADKGVPPAASPAPASPPPPTPLQQKDAPPQPEKAAAAPTGDAAQADRFRSLARTTSALVGAKAPSAPAASTAAAAALLKVEDLLFAVKNGDAAAVEILLKSCESDEARKLLVDTPGKGAGQWNSLHWAADKGFAGIIPLLLEAGAEKQWTALHWACSNGRPEAVRLLLAHGASHEPVNSEGKTPRELAEGKPAKLFRACVRLLGGDDEFLLADEAAAAGSPPGGAPSPAGDAAAAAAAVVPASELIARHGGSLQKAAVHGDVEAIRAILAANPSALDSTHGHGLWTALHEASDHGHLAAVLLLLDAGADIERTDAEGRTALHWAVKNGRAAVVEALLDRFADVEAKDIRGETPADYLKQTYNAAEVAPLLAPEAIRGVRKRRAEANGGRWAPECAVSLKFLINFHGEMLSAAPGITTGEMVGAVIKPRTEARRCRLAEMLDPRDVWSPGRGRPFHFISHAFGNPFRLVVESLVARFGREGAEDVFVWLDVFAINQWDTESDLNGGLTLRDTIGLSADTLVILDAQGVPLKRLWCLYEISETSKAQLQLVASGYDMLELAELFESVDVSTAGCFDPKAEKVIRRNIEVRCGSEEELTERLKLQLAMIVIRALREARQRGTLVIA